MLKTDNALMVKNIIAKALKPLKSIIFASMIGITKSEGMIPVKITETVLKECDFEEDKHTMFCT